MAQGAKALGVSVSYDGAVNTEMNDKMEEYKGKYFDMFFEYQGELYHLDSEKGKEIVALRRLTESQPDDWIPTCLDTDTAICKAMQKNHHTTFKAHAGTYAISGMKDISYLITAELENRLFKGFQGHFPGPDVKGKAPKGFQYPDQAAYDALSKEKKAELTADVNEMRRKVGLPPMNWNAYWSSIGGHQNSISDASNAQSSGGKKRKNGQQSGRRTPKGQRKRVKTATFKSSERVEEEDEEEDEEEKDEEKDEVDENENEESDGSQSSIVIDF